MDTKKLRQKILDLAIRGKLVPQDPSDEPASVLLERIRAEKERLIKEGKIKRSKKSASDDEIEAPFEIPESWEWTTIEDLLINRDSERVPLSLAIRKKQTNKIYDYYGAAGVIDKVDGYLFSERLLLIGEDGANLLSRSKDNAFFAEGQYWVNNHAHVLDCSEKYILDFVAFIINSMSLEKYVTGSAQPKLTQDNLNKIIISLPPKEEQRRIINEVKRWFTLIDELENNEGDLLKAIDKAKSQILDLAIHGKLVPQDPNDEPAIELLKRINPKFEPCDEVPWELPNNWCWTTLGNISNYGKCIHVEAMDIPNDSWVLELEDLEKDTAKLLQRVTCTEREIKGVRSVFRKGDILFSKLRTYLNKILVAPEDGYCSTEIVPISLCDSLSSHYINHVLRSKYFVEYTTSCGYGVKMPRLSTTDACNGLIPIPPYQEQLRIVDKIEQLFSVLDSIKESLEA